MCLIKWTLLNIGWSSLQETGSYSSWTKARLGDITSPAIFSSIR